jgi:hypothetical protein
MVIYLIYYIICLTILLLPSKFKSITFSIIWFLFVGFRDGIGIDYYSTLTTIERQSIDFNDIALSFSGYNFFDAEIIYKLIATFLSFSEFKINYSLTLIALLESIFIYYLIKSATNRNLFIFLVLSTFSLHYPMNAIRQGFCLISLIFANNYFHNKSVLKSKLFYLFSFITHYASIPVVLISRIKINIKSILIPFIFLLLIAKFMDFDTLFSRYSIDQIDAFTFKGNGLKLYLFVLLLFLLNTFVLNKSYLCTENIIIVIMLLITINFNPFFRLFYFYLYYVLYSEFYRVNYSKLNSLKKIFLISIPFFLFIFEWQEIFRFQPCIGCGNWVPYKSLLFK